VGAILFCLLAVVLTAVMVEATRRFAPIIGLVDAPTKRKSHEGDIPLVGGIAIFLGLILILPFSGILQDHWAFLLAASVLVAVGVWDDIREVGPTIRLAIQSAAVLFVAVFGDAVLLDVGEVIPGAGNFNLGWMALPFTVFAGIGLINAFNMSDGVDGLCGTLVLVALGGLGVVAALGGKHNELILIALLAGALVGFLIFNMRVPGRKHAKVFLGDAGSYLLGLAVLYLVVRLSQGPDRAMAPVSALWFCMLPLFDTVGMILRRIKRGKSPFSADREHIHHVFLLAKFSVSETWAGLTVVALIGMGIGLFASLTGVPELAMMATFAAAAVLYYWMIKRVWRVLRFLSRSINRRSEEAKLDRRSGLERRQQCVDSFLRELSTERRSGVDRRNENEDRRNAEEVAAESAALIARQYNAEGSGNRAA